MSLSAESVPYLWQAIGYAGVVIFYGRFYVQWIVSEIRKKSVIPIVFWYMSALGSLLLFAYGVAIQSPVGALSHSFNIVVYGRNLIHIWREQEKLHPVAYWIVHLLIMLTTTGAIFFLALTWWNEWHSVAAKEDVNVAAHWFWIGIGVIGQGCFAARFLVQWLLTEYHKKSVIPLVFWYLSIAGSVLMASSFTYRWYQGHPGEWLYAVGLTATLVVYIRNISLILRHKSEKVLK